MKIREMKTVMMKSKMYDLAYLIQRTKSNPEIDDGNDLHFTWSKLRL